MIFSSISFLFAFLSVVLLCYYICPENRRNVILMASGLLFYAWGEPVYVLLLLFTTLVDYTAGRLMERFREDPKRRKLMLILSITVNLSLLAVFKYSSFLIESLNGLFGISIFNPHLPLPIGISFYTFQSMSYTIDLYRGDTRMQKSYQTFHKNSHP